MTDGSHDGGVDRNTPENIDDESGFLSKQRTYLAAERTLFAVIRTGLAIAAGGAVIIEILGAQWPQWVRIPLAGAFLIVGYTLVIYGLNRYRGIAKHIKREGGQRMEIVRPGVMDALTLVLGIATTIVVLLFILEAFE
ncbi:MAG: YidH family protein [Acidimicrobiia bacterium]